MSRIGILWEARGEAEKSGSAIAFKEYEAAARTLQIQLQSLEIRGPQPSFDKAFRAASNARSDALITVHNALILLHQKSIADLAIKHRLPSLYEGNNYVAAGGLLSYATNDAELYKRSAIYVDKILKGAKPADLPVEQASKFELVINLKTAKQIGLTIPPQVLTRADKVIK
jgi:putative ABC transport system substrate-binding protein